VNAGGLLALSVHVASTRLIAACGSKLWRMSPHKGIQPAAVARRGHPPTAGDVAGQNSLVARPLVSGLHVFVFPIASSQLLGPSNRCRLVTVRRADFCPVILMTPRAAVELPNHRPLLHHASTPTTVAILTIEFTLLVCLCILCLPSGLPATWQPLRPWNLAHTAADQNGCRLPSTLLEVAVPPSPHPFASGLSA